MCLTGVCMQSIKLLRRNNLNWIKNYFLNSSTKSKQTRTQTRSGHGVTRSEGVSLRSGSGSCVDYSGVLHLEGNIECHNVNASQENNRFILWRPITLFMDCIWGKLRRSVVLKPTPVVNLPVLVLRAQVTVGLSLRGVTTAESAVRVYSQ